MVKEAGNFYGLLLGRVYQPHKNAILLDFDNKVEGETQCGKNLVDELNMDQYDAPKQVTPQVDYIMY